MGFKYKGKDVPTVEVAVGLSTKLGLGAGGASLVGAIVAAASGDRSEETLGALGAGVVLLGSVIWGRMLQATAAIKTAQPPLVPNTSGVIAADPTLKAESGA